jgi:hypothetical protein
VSEGDACQVQPDVAVLGGGGREPATLDWKAARVAAAAAHDAPADHVVELTDATLDDFLKNATTPVFLEFYNPT